MVLNGDKLEKEIKVGQAEWKFHNLCLAVRMWELDHKEALKNRCFQIVVIEKTLESPLDCKKIKPVNPKGNQPWIFTGRTDAEAPILWPPDPKSRLSGKDLNAEKERGQEEEERMRWLDDITNSTSMNLSKRGETVNHRGAWRAAVHGVTEWDTT